MLWSNNPDWEYNSDEIQTLNNTSNSMLFEFLSLSERLYVVIDTDILEPCFSPNWRIFSTTSSFSLRLPFSGIHVSKRKIVKGWVHLKQKETIWFFIFLFRAQELNRPITIRKDWWNNMLDLWVLVVSLLFPTLVYGALKVMFNGQWRKARSNPLVLRQARRFNNDLTMVFVLTIFLTSILWYLLY